MRTFGGYDTLFFDLDGTLADSKSGIIRSLRYSLEQFNIDEIDEEKLTRCIGPSLTFTYTQWYGLSDEDARRAVGFYRAYFERRGIYENTLFAGIPELLRALGEAGKRLVVATAKPTVHAKKILEHHNIAQMFADIFGSNLDGTREHKDEVIAFALESLQIERKESVLMIGDRDHDILGAKKNGIASVAVGYGYGAAEELKRANPHAIASSVAELRSLLLGK